MKHKKSKIINKVIALLMLLMVSTATMSSDVTLHVYGQDMPGSDQTAVEQSAESEDASDQKAPEITNFTGNFSDFLEEAKTESKTGLQQTVAIREEVDDSVVDANKLDEEEIETQGESLHNAASTSEWTKYSSDYYYNQLSAKEKLLYDRMDTASSNNMTSSTDFTVALSDSSTVNAKRMDAINVSDIGLDEDEVDDVFQMFYEVEGQYYYLNNHYVMSASTLTGQVYSVTLAVYDKFAKGADRIQYTNKVKTQLNTYINQINQSSTQYLKQKAAHDLILENVTYKSNDYDQSIVSALLSDDTFSKETVCAGYAKLFQVLCNGAGVESISTVSYTHAWDYVKFDGLWYIVDCTWDDHDALTECNQAPYLDIDYNTLRFLDDSSVHEAIPYFWKYAPKTTKNYIPAGTANSWKVGDNVTATLNSNGVLTIAGTGATYNYYNGTWSPITESPYVKNIRTVVVSEGVTYLGCSLLYNCIFTSISLPSTLTSMYKYMFINNDSLVKIINNSNVSIDIYDEFGTLFDENWKNALTGASVETIPAKATIIKSNIIKADRVFMSEKSIEIEVGETYNLSALIYPYNTTNKTIVWSSSNTDRATVSNGKVTGVGKGYTTIYAKIDGCSAHCNVKIVAASKNGLQLGDDNQWHYYKKGSIDQSYTGLAKNSNGWYYVKNGTLDWSYTGLAQYDGTWYYVKNGALDWNYTGIATNSAGNWYVQKGVISFKYTGMVQVNKTWYYVSNSKFVLDYTGLAKNQYGWWYFSNGKLNTNYTGLASNSSGTFYVVKGTIDWNYTGMVQGSDGWYYVCKGGVIKTYTGMAKNSAGWWYFSNGKIDWHYTGMANNSAGWWYFTDGKLDWSYTGMAHNNLGWWYYRNGRIDFKYTGVGTNNSGKWYYKNGTIDFSYTGLAKDNNDWLYFKNGKFTSTYNGKATNQFGTWNVVNGKVQF